MSVRGLLAVFAVAVTLAASGVAVYEADRHARAERRGIDGASTPIRFSDSSGNTLASIGATSALVFSKSNGTAAVTIDLDKGTVVLAPGMETGDAALEFWTDVRKISRLMKGEAPCSSAHRRSCDSKDDASAKPWPPLEPDTPGATRRFRLSGARPGDTCIPEADPDPERRIAATCSVVSDDEIELRLFLASVSLGPVVPLTRQRCVEVSR